MFPLALRIGQNVHIVRYSCWGQKYSVLCLKDRELPIVFVESGQLMETQESSNNLVLTKNNNIFKLTISI